MTKKKIIAVDVDGTLLRNNGFQGLDHFGKPFPGAVEFSKALSKLGHVLIYTCRTNPALGRELDPAGLDDRAAQEWLKAKVKKALDGYGIHYDEIYAGPGKPDADVFIDDKAIDCRPAAFNASGDPTAYYEMVALQAKYRLQQKRVK